MALSLAQITVDCHRPLPLAQFWASAFGVTIDAEPEPSEFVASIGRNSPDQPTMLFINVGEDKLAKNRVHLDLQSDDREAEVERFVGLGATRIHDKDEWGVRWTTLADPEGNEFCVATH